MKRFLVLGIGNAQVDLLRYLKELGGIEVHAVSYNSDGRGVEIADKFELINIADKEHVLEYVKRENIDFIYSIGSDIAMPTASWVAEQANLPHYVNHRTAEICNNKHELRQALKESPLNLAFTFASDLQSLSWDVFPAMIKPVDSQGQRGVFRVESRLELETFFPKAISFSRSNRVIVEEFVDGPEYSINLFLKNGEIVFSQFSDRVVWNEYPGGIIKSHHLPCTAINYKEQGEVLSALKQIFESVGLLNGPAYCQMKLGVTGSKVIEITPRLDGCHMWRAISEFCGVDLLDLSVKNLISEFLELDTISKEAIPYSLSLEFFAQPPGSKIQYSDEKRECRYEERYYESGSLTPRMNGFIEKTGYFIY